MSKLVLHIPGGGTRDVRLDRDRITIGRRADNDVHLPYPAVSAEHAAIITVREDSFLEDLQSTNGTLVNGKRITKHFLRDHDTIEVGRVQLVFVLNDDELVEPLPASDLTEVAPSADDEHPDSDGELLPTSEESDPRESAPVEHLLAELMNSSGLGFVAVDIQPPISITPVRASTTERASRTEATSGVYLEVMSGPNAGQIAPMRKREFVLGKSGATQAVIRRDAESFVIVPQGADPCTINGRDVPPDGMRLSLGDTIDIAGVRLRFARRLPL